MTIAEEVGKGARRPFEESFEEVRPKIVEILKKEGKVIFMFLPWGEPIEPTLHTDGSNWFNVNQIWESELPKKLKEEGLRYSWGNYKDRIALTAYL